MFTFFMLTTFTVKECKTPQIENGFFKVKGSYATFSCDQNYVLSGDEQLKCQDGKWIGTVPQCITWFSYCQDKNRVAVLERNTYKCWTKKGTMRDEFFDNFVGYIFEASVSKNFFIWN